MSVENSSIKANTIITTLGNLSNKQDLIKTFNCDERVVIEKILKSNSDNFNFTEGESAIFEKFAQGNFTHEKSWWKNSRIFSIYKFICIRVFKWCKSSSDLVNLIKEKQSAPRASTSNQNTQPIAIQQKEDRINSSRELSISVENETSSIEKFDNFQSIFKNINEETGRLTKWNESYIKKSEIPSLDQITNMNEKFSGLKRDLEKQLTSNLENLSTHISKTDKESLERSCEAFVTSFGNLCDHLYQLKIQARNIFTYASMLDKGDNYATYDKEQVARSLQQSKKKAIELQAEIKSEILILKDIEECIVSILNNPTQFELEL